MNATDRAIYGPSLYSATMAAERDAVPLRHDMDVDVCVIGAGLAGLTTAREIARRGWSVIVVEAKRVAWNASGRNTGFVLPGYAQSAAKIVDRIGPERARGLWALSRIGVDYVRATIVERALNGVIEGHGWLAVSKIDDAASVAAEAALLQDILGENVELWPTEQVRAQLRTSRYYQALHFPDAFHIHPLNYALGLAAAAEEAGARIFEDTSAIAIDPAGVRKRIDTPRARIRAAHVVLAGNVHLRGLMPTIARTLLPVTTYTIATAPLGESLDQAITYRGAVSDTEWADSHYRVTPERRLIWCGRMTMWEANPKRFARRLRAEMTRLYPQLGKPEIEFAWNGTLGNTVHRMPQIGEVSPGLWLASGFGGHGLNTTAVAGVLIAGAIVEGDDTWQAFRPYDLVWAGGVLGRSFVQGAYWASRMREGIAAWSSRRKEARALKQHTEGANAASGIGAAPMAAEPIVPPPAAPSGLPADGADGPSEVPEVTAAAPSILPESAAEPDRSAERPSKARRKARGA
jgi:gamma-glutamylputrescine oxidase